MEWRPIATAPKDRLIIGWFPELASAREMVWGKAVGTTEHWMIGLRLTPFDPTHWMPLPEPPALEGEK